jgi:two-component system, chemotaxis family, chemotaxis protein CheY
MSSQRTILIVDDIPLMRTILAKYVRTLSLRILAQESGGGTVRIVEASNGKEALEILKAGDIDLVFLDLMMPEMDGLTFLSVKRADPNLGSVPVIVCSALGEKDTVDRARGLGAVGYIMKPFTMRSVEERLREALPVLQE